MSAIKSELRDIVAEVYAGNVDLEWCYVKISFIGLGMYINSFKVTRSKNFEGYVVYPPSHSQRGRGLTPSVEFDKSQLQLWSVIERTALQAFTTWKESEGDFNTAIAKSSDYVELFKRTDSKF